MIHLNHGEVEADSLPPRDPLPFQGADSCVVSDALDRHGIAGAAGGLRRLAGRGLIAGRVRTLQVSRAPTQSARAGAHLATGAIASARPGEILVVANGGELSAAVWGGLLGRAASLRGVAGVVIDGAVRDVDELNDLRFPAFAAGASPRSARGRFVETAHQVPVVIDGVRVRPGDWVIADGSGVVFVPLDRAGAIARTVAALLEAEAGFRARLDGGEAVEAVLGMRYESLSRPEPQND